MSDHVCGSCRWFRGEHCQLFDVMGSHGEIRRRKRVDAKQGLRCGLWDPVESEDSDGMNTPIEPPQSCCVLAFAAVEGDDLDGVGVLQRQARAGMRRNGVPTGDRGDTYRRTRMPGDGWGRSYE